MSISARIGNLLKQPEIKTQTRLSELTGIDQTQISKMLRGAQGIEKFRCLLFAGVASSSEDREFWLLQSGISESQRRLVLGAIAPEITMPDKRHASTITELVDILEARNHEQSTIVKGVITTSHRYLFPERHKKSIEPVRKIGSQDH